MQLTPDNIFRRGAFAEEYRAQIRKAQLDYLWPIAERINSGKTTLAEEARREELEVATLRQRLYTAGIVRQYVKPEQEESNENHS